MSENTCHKCGASPADCWCDPHMGVHRNAVIVNRVRVKMELEADWQDVKRNSRIRRNESRRSESLDHIEACQSIASRGPGDYAKLIQTRRLLARGYRTTGDVEDVRFLSAVYALGELALILWEIRYDTGETDSQSERPNGVAVPVPRPREELHLSVSHS